MTRTTLAALIGTAAALAQPAAMTCAIQPPATATAKAQVVLICSAPAPAPAAAATLALPTTPGIIATDGKGNLSAVIPGTGLYLMPQATGAAPAAPAVLSLSGQPCTSDTPTLMVQLTNGSCLPVYIVGPSAAPAAASLSNVIDSGPLGPLVYPNPPKATTP
jgi:hypothetical protein